ncbi:hypothetical protein [Streptomyces sp. NPDC006668]|uniref:hypothetical protein n=1 Tax=Streptomyces sp. NPDC006668 TaxID=3156903 RepID=UPI0033F9093B
MALTLFSRSRPAPVKQPTPEPWPEIGETWTPEGVTVSERYYNLAHAVVLVYKAEGADTAHAVACLGCHFHVTKDKQRTYSTRYTLREAGEVANEHAAACRALPRTLPTRPNDDGARELLHQWVRDLRRGEDFYLRIHHFDLGRLFLQRTNAWITTELQHLADSQPDLLRIQRTTYGDGKQYLILPQPKGSETRKGCS